MCYDSAPWIIKGEMDRYQFPRKYAQGPIQGESVARAPDKGDTDDKEYFGRLSLGFPAVIDERYYKAQAEWPWGFMPPTALSNGRTLRAQPPHSGYYFLDEETARFSAGNLSLYRIEQSSAVLFIDGSARFENIGLDLKEGALVVKGNLTLAPQTLGQGLLLSDIRIPPHAAEEYPYEPMSLKFPCRSESSRSCQQPVNIQIRSFVYVQGDLILEAPSFGESVWVINGTLRVDGQLIVPENTHLIVYYDDQIGDAMQVANASVFAVSTHEH